MEPVVTPAGAPPLGRRTPRGGLWAVGVLASAGLVAGLAYTARVSYAHSDPAATLIVSQAILEHRTIRLDAYVDDPDYPIDHLVGHHIVKRGGHYYGYFPVAPAVLSVPAVWGARRLGLDMRVGEQNREVQHLLSAVTCGVVLVLIYLLGRSRLSPGASLAIALVFVLGSSLISTLGTALWSLNFAVLFELVTLVLIMRLDAGRVRAVSPWLVGTLLFAAFASRVSTAPFVAMVLVYLFVRRRVLFWPAAATAGVLLAAFTLWWRWEQGQWAPEYGSLSRFGAAREFGLWAGVWGHLVSPSRGVLVFSPFLVVVGLMTTRVVRRLSGDLLFVSSVAAVAAHLLVASSATRWWGGFSFGPRILTDAMPLLLVATVATWCAVTSARTPVEVRGWALAFGVLGACGIFINSYQGLYNVQTVRWNGAMPPTVDEDPASLFSWRYPQFLATAQSICDRHRDRILASYTEYGARERLGVYAPGRAVSAVDAQAVFVGWSEPQADDEFRWSVCPASQVLLPLGRVAASLTHVLEVVSGAAGHLRVEVRVNGVAIGDLAWSGPAERVERRVLEFHGARLRPDAFNAIEFRVTGARFMGIGESAPLGLALRGVRLSRVE